MHVLRLRRELCDATVINGPPRSELRRVKHGSRVCGWLSDGGVLCGWLEEGNSSSFRLACACSVYCVIVRTELSPPFFAISAGGGYFLSSGVFVVVDTSQYLILSSAVQSSRCFLLSQLFITSPDWRSKNRTSNMEFIIYGAGPEARSVPSPTSRMTNIIVLVELRRRFLSVFLLSDGKQVSRQSFP